jgi:nucleoside phosphorylase
MAANLDDLREANAKLKAAPLEQRGDIFNEIVGKKIDVLKRMKVAVINAIPHEYAATNIIFGEPEVIPVLGKRESVIEYVTLKDRAGNDIFVALAGTSGQGIAQAAAATALIAHKCPKIEMIILIGIAAGQPNLFDKEKDVRLGDIVVGDKMIQYDHIKRTDGKTELRGDNLHPGDSGMLATVRRLLALQFRTDPNPPKKVWEDLIAQNVGNLSNAARPPSSRDPHSTRRDYTKGHHLQRSDDLPFVHVGTIGSANILLKDAAFRDELNRNHGTIAYEMEGAGVAIAAASMRIGYLNVRGICDYGDSGKDDSWQTYASLCAASFARAIIESE